MKKYKVRISEVIEHTYEVEEVNEYMAKEAGRKLLSDEQRERIRFDNKDIFVEEISSETTPKKKD